MCVHYGFLITRFLSTNHTARSLSTVQLRSERKRCKSQKLQRYVISIAHIQVMVYIDDMYSQKEAP
jgi:hypothetical protein